MALTVWIAADTLGYPSGAGHLWAYLNWALGLKAIGCKIVWMEPRAERADPEALGTLVGHLDSFGLQRICLFDADGSDVRADDISVVAVEEAAEADLLLNLAYGVPPSLVSRFRRSALLDIDPGQTQTWMSAGDLAIAPHNVYLTTGEGVAKGTASVPNCGVNWLYAAPCVALDVWPITPPPSKGAYTTVTHWWGDDIFVMPDRRLVENSKRASFLPYLPIVRSAPVELELAVSADDLEDEAALLANHGWRITDPVEAAGTPERYRSYIQRSRGEFSCAKPAYSELNTGWISDRTVCYLASGRPAIVQYTGPCELLDEADGEGVFRFADPERASAALVRADRDHPQQCALARALAERHFDARASAGRLLELCLV